MHYSTLPHAAPSMATWLMTQKLQHTLVFSVQFLHVKCDGNLVAHSLAKRARFSQPFEVWMKFVPLDVVSILCTDFPSH
jgi:hypothetical protein